MPYPLQLVYHPRPNGGVGDPTGGDWFTITAERGLSIDDQVPTGSGVRDCYALRWARYATGEQLDEDDERMTDIETAFRANDDVPGLLQAIATSDLFRFLRLDPEPTP